MVPRSWPEAPSKSAVRCRMMSLSQNQCGPGCSGRVVTLTTVSGSDAAPASPMATHAISNAASRRLRIAARLVGAWPRSTGGRIARMTRSGTRPVDRVRVVPAYPLGALGDLEPVLPHRDGTLSDAGAGGAVRSLPGARRGRRRLDPGEPRHPHRERVLLPALRDRPGCDPSRLVRSLLLHQVGGRGIPHLARD